MSKIPSPFEIIEKIRRGNTEAILWQTRPNNPSLTNFLKSTLCSNKTDDGALMGDPIIEAAYPFIEAKETFGELSGNLLNDKLVGALAGEYEPTNQNYKFDKNRYPYKHQLEVWQSLSQNEPRSVLVSSGTGSGKTECFLVPLLNDLANQAEQNSRVSGVQAIIIYPLNALIESQKERLQKWTKPFEGAIRFALYNGMTKETAKEKDKKNAKKNGPEQVIYRDEIRSNPPPILVTNITMLEYMLVRKKDNPIIENSKDLKWIILDEAHTHIGAAAAELTLLIRRVLETFGKKPDEVRFVATSATIGSGNDEQKKNQLSNFMQAITGQSKDRIDIVLGNRELPKLPPIKPQYVALTLPNIVDSEAMYEALAPNPNVQNLLNKLIDKNFGSVSFSDFREVAKKLNPDLDVGDFAIALSNAAKNGISLAPLRIHAFHRIVPGVWSCINENCKDKPSGWRFGKLLHKQSAFCPCCNSPVLEVLSCNECGEVALHGERRNNALIQVRDAMFSDEFAKTIEVEETPDDDIQISNEKSTNTETDEFDEDDEVGDQFLYPVQECKNKSTAHYWDIAKHQLVGQPNENTLKLQAFKQNPNDTFTCPSCQSKAKSGKGNIMQNFAIGAPFILLNTNPILLDGSPQQYKVTQLDENEQITKNPGSGRQLLSFTDSRQGTARLAAKFEKDSERNFVRGFIYQSVQKIEKLSDQESETIKNTIASLEVAIKSNPGIAPNMIPLLEAEKAKLVITPKPISFDEMKSKLANNEMVSEWIHRKLWKLRDFDVFSSQSKTAEFLLKREIYRRSRYANTIETLGLASIKYPEIDKISASNYVKNLGIDDAEWRNFLYIIINFWMRPNLSISIDKRMLHWVNHNQYPTWIVPSDSDKNDKFDKIFSPFGKNKMPNLPCKLLFAALGWDLSNESNRNKAFEIYRFAWNDLKEFLRKDDKFLLQFEKSAFSKLENAYICPKTKRIIDNVFMGFSPYSADDLLKTNDKEALKAQLIEMPTHPIPFSLADEKYQIEDWLKNDDKIVKLRQLNLWGNLQDRVSRDINYYRSVEHSAQIDRPILEEYENEFKAFQINILNCSTTMEMGVDIGSVSTIMMNNLPPAISNYRQRVGRAGRRGQNLATSFTLCKDRPLDQMAFNDPINFLRKEMIVPKVALDSEKIVQRHINSWALADFFRNKMPDSSGHSTDCKDFFGYNADGQKLFATTKSEQLEGVDTRSNCEKFIAYIDSKEFADNNEAKIKSIIRGSDLVHCDIQLIIDDITNSMVDIQKVFCDRVDALFSVYSKFQENEKGKNSLYYQIKRITGEFLLKFLGEKGFLPGHGFPRDIADFNTNENKENKWGGDGANYNSFPKRQLDIALREYAPGASVTINGLVYKSAGISLNWKRPSSEKGVKEVQDLKYYWACEKCGTIGDNHVENCSKCASNVEVFKALKPSGFVASLSEDDRHDNVDDVNYIKMEPMKISLSHKELQELSVAELGNFRAANDATAYFTNKGRKEGSLYMGFAICLECGRAEPHDAMDINPIKNHKRIDFKSGKTISCSGSDKTYAVQENVILTHNYLTDAFELQFKKMNSIAGVRAFGSALREVMADKLGIEPSELGIEVASNDKKTLFIYDTASGGAGYSVQIPIYFDDLIEKIRDTLDCKSNCETGCGNCVVNNIVGGRDKPVNRIDALAWASEYIKYIGKVEPEDNIGIKPKQISDVFLEIDREIDVKTNNKITMCIAASSEEDTLSWLVDSNISNTFERWQKRGAKVQIAFNETLLNELEPDEIFKLIRFEAKTGAQIGQLSHEKVENHNIIATIGDDLLILSRDESFKIGEKNYGLNLQENGVLIKTRKNFPNQFTPLNLQELIKTKPLHKQIDIGKEFNGNFVTFGEKISSFILKELGEINALGSGRVKSINYCDKYCTSPQSVRLLLETVRNLIIKLKIDYPLELDLSVRILGGNIKPPYAWHHDWVSFEDIEDASIDLCKDYNISLEVNEYKKLKHRRNLDIVFDDGTISQITFDQGFGYWYVHNNIKKSVKFDFNSLENSKSDFKKNYLVENLSDEESYLVFRKK